MYEFRLGMRFINHRTERTSLHFIRYARAHMLKRRNQTTFIRREHSLTALVDPL